MSWSLNASGNVADEAAEADLIRKLADAVTDAGCAIAQLSTQYHGTVDLLDEADAPDADSNYAEPDDGERLVDDAAEPVDE